MNNFSERVRKCFSDENIPDALKYAKSYLKFSPQQIIKNNKIDWNYILPIFNKEQPGYELTIDEVYDDYYWDCYCVLDNGYILVTAIAKELDKILSKLNNSFSIKYLYFPR